MKIDRRDARVLAEMLAVGSVTEVRIPDPEAEALRDLSRLRSGTAKDVAHAQFYPGPRRRAGAFVLVQSADPRLFDLPPKSPVQKLSE